MRGKTGWNLFIFIYQSFTMIMARLCTPLLAGDSDPPVHIADNF